jgi:hypothetical protein
MANRLVANGRAAMFWWTWVWYGGLALLAIGVLIVVWYRLATA